MILTCPECATRYEIDSAKFPAAGRKVRCKKCGHVWFQAGEGGAAEPSPPPPIPQAPVLDDVTSPVSEEAPEAENVSADAISPVRAYRGKVAAAEAFAPASAVTKQPARGAAGRRIAAVFGWIALIGVVLVIGWSATSYRQQIASVWPQSASLFARIGMGVNTRGIDFADVQHKNQIEDGQPVLVITGKLVNVSARQMKVPPLRGTLSDSSKRIIYSWSFSAGTALLEPGEATAFHTRLSNPPSAAHHVDIHFADAGE